LIADESTKAFTWAVEILRAGADSLRVTALNYSLIITQSDAKQVDISDVAGY
jgi:hypothetical protein